MLAKSPARSIVGSPSSSSNGSNLTFLEQTNAEAGTVNNPSIPRGLFQDDDPNSLQDPLKIGFGGFVAALRSEFAGAAQDKFSLPTDAPRSFKKALESTDAEASFVEFDSLCDNYKVIKYIKRGSLPHNVKILRFKLVFTYKYKTGRAIIDRKVRMVAMGNSQCKQLNFKETFSPSLKFTSLCPLMAHFVEHDYIIEQTDINKVYLHGKLKEDHLYVTIPDEFIKLHPSLTGKFLHLKKSLYSLRQAGRC